MIPRRDFLKKSLSGTAALSIGGMGFSAKSYGSIVGSNDRINAAVVGIGGRGSSLINEVCSLKNSNNVHLITLCDVDEQFFAPRSKTVFDRTGIKPTTEWDMRRVFDNKNIDAVWFATPNFWHALGTIWACQSGKHVYVEKPSSHNVFEGRKMIEASRKYNVRVQVGYGLRSMNNVLSAMELLHSGGIGRVYMAKGLCYKQRDSFGIAADSTPPSTLHYDMWLGPVSYYPYNEKRLHYNWHWFWNTGNGDSGNQGTHQFDVARWGLNKNEHPVSIFSMGGIFGIDPKECAQETPNTQSSLFRYTDGTILEFVTRGRYTNSESSLGINIGNIFYGTDGYLELQLGGTWKAFRKNEKEPFDSSELQKAEKRGSQNRLGHSANFVESIRSGRNEDLYCDIIDGHYSSVLPHLANISYRLGRELRFFGEYEKFSNDPEADLMLTRVYRKPYVVPDEV